MLMGCVQPAMMPNINSATARVLDAAGIQTLVADERRLLRRDPHAPERPRRRPDRHAPQHRRLVAAWWPSRRRVEAIVMNASGCGVTVKEYGHALAHDPAYADKAARISELTRDLSELLPDLVPALQRASSPRRSRGRARLAFHPPCTLQHGQQLRGGVEPRLARAGLRRRLAPQREPPVLRLGRHLLGAAARARPPAARPQARAPRRRWRPQAIVSANIGCIQHLQTARRRRCATGSRCWTTR